MYSIYKITNIINNKIYIGQTIRDVQKRFMEHKKKSPNKCIKLQNAFNKYGRDNFIIEVIKLLHTKEEADIVEVNLIEFYDSVKNGYNICRGGRAGARLGCIVSEEVREKISKSRKGQKLTEETKKKISISKKGVKFSEDHIKNLCGRIPWNKKKTITTEAP